jgi:hypothetical protein
MHCTRRASRAHASITVPKHANIIHLLFYPKPQTIHIRSLAQLVSVGVTRSDSTGNPSFQWDDKGTNELLLVAGVTVTVADGAAGRAPVTCQMSRSVIHRVVSGVSITTEIHTDYTIWDGASAPLDRLPSPTPCSKRGDRTLANHFTPRLNGVAFVWFSDSALAT